MLVLPVFTVHHRQSLIDLVGGVEIQILIRQRNQRLQHNDVAISSHITSSKDMTLDDNERYSQLFVTTTPFCLTIISDTHGNRSSSPPKAIPRRITLR